MHMHQIKIIYVLYLKTKAYFASWQQPKTYRMEWLKTAVFVKKKKIKRLKGFRVTARNSTTCSVCFGKWPLGSFVLILKTIRHQGRRKITISQGRKLKARQTKGKHSRVQSSVTSKKGKLFRETMLRERKQRTQVNKLILSTCPWDHIRLLTLRKNFSSNVTK